MTSLAFEAEQKQKWNTEFDQGRWDFLHKPEEQTRLKTVAAMIDDLAEQQGSRVIVVDLGSGEGMLANWLPAKKIAHYIAVDLSEVALSRVPHAAFPVTTHASSIEKFAAQFVQISSKLALEPDSPIVFVANEVLYYDLDSINDIAVMIDSKKAAGLGNSHLIISAVGPHPDKPNWTKSSRNLWARVGKMNWNLANHTKISQPNSLVHWDIAQYQV